MTWIATVFGISLLLMPLVVSIRRSTELFKLKVRDGKAHFVRGRIPQSLLSDVNDIVRSPAIARAEIRAVRRGGKARLEANGELTPEQRQRLRNVLGAYSLQRIMAGGRTRGR